MNFEDNIQQAIIDAELEDYLQRLLGEPSARPNFLNPEPKRISDAEI